MKTEKEIAIEAGVPIPETCELLNWQKETKVALCKCKISGNYYYAFEVTWTSPFRKEFVCYAPQIDELLAANSEIGYDPEGFFYKKTVNFYGIKEVYTKDVEDGHFAEALAQLIIAT